jgi:hypothetical protein
MLRAVEGRRTWEDRESPTIQESGDPVVCQREARAIRLRPETRQRR